MSDVQPSPLPIDRQQRGLQDALDRYRSAATVAEIAVIAADVGLRRSTLVRLARATGTIGACYGRAYLSLEAAEELPLILETMRRAGPMLSGSNLETLVANCDMDWWAWTEIAAWLGALPPSTQKQYGMPWPPEGLVLLEEDKALARQQLQGVRAGLADDVISPQSAAELRERLAAKLGLSSEALQRLEDRVFPPSA